MSDKKIEEKLAASDHVVKLGWKDEILESIDDFIFWHKKAIIIVVVALVALVILVVGLFYAIPTVRVNGVQYTALNTKVRIKSGEEVRLKNGGISVKVQRFTNESCPEGRVCFGNGEVRSVEYMLTVDGDKFSVGSSNKKNNSDYEVETIKTDYKTYSDIRIIKTTR